jgi:hypothetical protein
MFSALSQRFTVRIALGVVRFAQVAEAETAVGKFLSQLLPSCLKRCAGGAGKFQQYNAWGETPRCTLQ